MCDGNISSVMIAKQPLCETCTNIDVPIVGRHTLNDLDPSIWCTLFANRVARILEIFWNVVGTLWAATKSHKQDGVLLAIIGICTTLKYKNVLGKFHKILTSMSKYTLFLVNFFSFFPHGVIVHL